jgi:hypothetical protein
VKCGTYSGTRNGRPVMGLSSSAVEAGAGRGAVGSSDIRHTEHTVIVTTGRRARTVHSSARSVCGRGRKALGKVIWVRATEPRYCGEVCPHLHQKWGYAGAFADPDGHMWQVSRVDGFLTQ